MASAWASTDRLASLRREGATLSLEEALLC
jgi:hypothetical protein